MSFLRFLGSGLFSTLLDLGLFRLLTLFGVMPLLAYPLSYSFCVVVRYFIDARLTFATERMHLRQFLMYFLANLAVMLLGLLAFDIAKVYYAVMLAKLLSIPVTVLSGFVIMRFVVFAKPEPPAEPQ